MSMNKVMMVGRLTDDPILTYTGGNTAVARATIAVNRNFKNNNGEREADFFNIVVWRKYGENFANWAKKGDLISIVARAQNYNYEKDGVRHYTVTFVVEEWDILESRASRSNRQNGGTQGMNDSDFGNSTPNFGRTEPSPFGGGGNPMDISDDDLPF